MTGDGKYPDMPDRSSAAHRSKSGGREQPALGAGGEWAARSFLLRFFHNVDETQPGSTADLVARRLRPEPRDPGVFGSPSRSFHIEVKSRNSLRSSGVYLERTRLVEWLAIIETSPVLGGLIHEYRWAA